MSRQVEEIVFTYEDDDGEEQEGVLPAKFEVCGRCRGHGMHVNPSIDGNGITSSEWEEWDDEEREHYFRGDYDVPCEGCHGARVVQVVDEEHADPDMLERYYEQEDSLAESRAIEAAERRFGA